MKNDGGPAFPLDGEHAPCGMTMRQYYKAAALTGLLAKGKEFGSQWWDVDKSECDTGSNEWAYISGLIADAMLKEDEEHEAR